MDLIRRQQGPVRIPSADQTDTFALVDDLLGPAVDTDGGRGWLAKAAKLTGLGVGSLVLCGSVVLASTLTRDHRPPVNTALAPETVLTGVGALRPDTLAAQLSGRHTTPGADPSADQDAADRAAGSATGTIVGSARPMAPAAPPAAALVPPAGQLSAADVVRTFFREATSAPSAAAALVDPSLVAADPIGFAQSWDATSQLRIESIQTNPDGTVQAVVRMLGADGTWMRVVELVHVTLGNNPLITGAELLSAQHG